MNETEGFAHFVNNGTSDSLFFKM